jgi:hypothetical protein
MSQIQAEQFTQALHMLLDETFDTVNGIFLDKGTSMFQTLATISAQEASVPVGGRCATLAAQVEHVAFYLDVLETSHCLSSGRASTGPLHTQVTARFRVGLGNFSHQKERDR